MNVSVLLLAMETSSCRHMPAAPRAVPTSNFSLRATRHSRCDQRCHTQLGGRFLAGYAPPLLSFIGRHVSCKYTASVTLRSVSTLRSPSHDTGPKCLFYAFAGHEALQLRADRRRSLRKVCTLQLRRSGHAAARRITCMVYTCASPRTLWVLAVD